MPARSCPPYTLENYRSDLAVFCRWQHGATGEDFAARAITPDLREFKAFLITVERRSPATVNRRLAALKKFLQFAQAQGWVKELPTDSVKGVQSVPKTPRAVCK